MKSLVWSSLLLCVYLGMAFESGAQTPVGALAIDERRGDQYGWAVDYETAAAAQGRALEECGAGCSVVLTFSRCAAYVADQDADSTAVGWAESFDSAAGARQAALRECHARGGGSGCAVRVWGCNGSVVEKGLNLDRAARRRIQEGWGGRLLSGIGMCQGGAVVKHHLEEEASNGARYHHRHRSGETEFSAARRLRGRVGCVPQEAEPGQGAELHGVAAAMHRSDGVLWELAPLGPRDREARS